MCSETKQRYTCGCYVMLIHVCAEHIEHTRKQTDEEPCPDLVKQDVLCRQPGCPPGRCASRQNTFWTFEKLTSNLFGCEKKKERLQKERREQQQEESNIMAAATDTDTPRATKRRAQERQLIKEGDADFDDEYSPPESAHRSEPPTSPESHRAIKQECPYCESRSFKNGYCDDCGESVVDDPALDVLNQYPATICFHPDIKDGVCQFDEDGVCVNCGGLLETRTAAATAGLGASSRSTDSQVVLDPNFCAHVSIREGVCETCGVAVDTECLNKACLIPKIKDGVCYNCGHVTGFDYMAGEEAEDDAEMEERGV